MNIRLAPAVAAFLCSLAAAASGAQRTFLVGAFVATSARVSAATAPGNVIRVRLGGRGAPAPGLLAGGRLRVVAGSAITVPAPAKDCAVITVLY